MPVAKICEIRWCRRSTAPLSTFPRTLIVVGTHDCLLDDSRYVSTRMCAAGGVDATLVEIAGGFHGFILMPAPESKEARRQISSFVGAASTIDEATSAV